MINRFLINGLNISIKIDNDVIVNFSEDYGPITKCLRLIAMKNIIDKDDKIIRNNDSKWLLTIRSEEELNSYLQLDRLLLIIEEYPEFDKQNYNDISITIYEIYPKKDICSNFSKLIKSYFSEISKDIYTINENITKITNMHKLNEKYDSPQHRSYVGFSIIFLVSELHLVRPGPSRWVCPPSCSRCAPVGHRCTPVALPLAPVVLPLASPLASPSVGLLAGVLVIIL